MRSSAEHGCGIHSLLHSAHFPVTRSRVREGSPRVARLEVVGPCRAHGGHVYMPQMQSWEYWADARGLPHEDDGTA